MKNVIVSADKRQSVSLAQVAVVHQPVPVIGIILYTLLFVAAAAIIAFFYGATISPGITGIKAIIIPAGCFIFIGLLFTAFLYTGLRFLSRSDYNGGIIYALIVFTGVFAASFFMGLFKGDASLITSLFYSSLFVLPFTIYQAWLIYGKLSFLSYNKIWYLPQQTQQPPKRATVFLNSIHIKIKIPPMQGGAEYVYETTVPGRMSVGEMFNDLVNNRTNADNSDDTFDEVSSGDCGWQFFVPSFLGLGTRLVDAEASLDKNRIKNNGVVIARRIPVQFTYPEITNQN